jgi:protein Tex
LEKYIAHISSLISIPQKQINQVAALVAEGCSIPFIARYRKEATGNLDEVQIAQAVEQLEYFAELDKRKIAILKSIEEQGKLTPELQKRIEDCLIATKLEDIYLPYKPKRKTRATMAIERGLEPLAKMIFEQNDIDLINKAEKYKNDQIASVDDALQGARDIIAEWITEDERARNTIRNLFADGAIVTSKLLSAKAKDPAFLQDTEGQKYRDYFDFTEPLSKCPSHRILAIRRGEKEGILMMDILISKEIAEQTLKDIFVKNNYTSTAEQVGLSIEDGYSRLLKMQIETEFRLSSKQKADEEAINVFSENLRQLLLASPLGQKRVMALDPGFKSGCKLVCIDEYGEYLYYETIFPHAPQNQWNQAKETIAHLADKYKIEAIGYGNGTASKETESLVRGIDFGKPMSIFMVNESGASIYSASDVAREEFPDKDVTIRGAISIGRRLLDPLSELVKIDPKSIGVGQYQHDVNQPKLKSSLDLVVESCVNFVGVDVNAASKHLLTYVSGLSANMAKNIVDYRTANGPFKSRQEIKKVAGLGVKAFEQSAGFLRIHNSTNSLDNSAVHPESYHIVEKMAKDQNCKVEDLIKNSETRKKIKLSDYVSENVGLFTLNDIIKELDKPGRDPRSPIEEFRFAEGISTISDLKEGMTVPGIITNITKFGAFVNIGVKQDGMVHISQMSHTFIKDPNEVVKLGQKVQVMITEIDYDRGRVALSMKGEKQQSTTRGHAPLRNTTRLKPVEKKEEVLDDFQSKLLALKDKMK